MDTTAATIELRATANASQFTRTHAVADTTESPNLSLRPVKKHTNIRLGKKIDLTGYPSKSSLFTISNKHGWFFAGNEHGIIASPLSELRTALGQSNTDEEATFLCQVTLDLGSTVPLFISLAAGEDTLVVASSSVILTWDVQAILKGETAPSNSLTLNGLVVVDIHPNPGDNPELVAILTTGQSQDAPCVVVLFNCVTQTEMVRWSGLIREGTAPVAISWSTRGKQIAIGTSGGDILQYSPTDPALAKATIPQAQGPDLGGTMPIMIQWLSNYTFYVIYAQPRQEASLDDYQPDQHNYILTYDKKNSHVTDTSIPLPWDPYGLSREPGHQIKSLRGWGRFKHLIFTNDAHASDVGLIGCIGDASSSEESGVWSKISFEDGSITFPLTSDMDETSLVGMDMDLSAELSLLGANQANGDDPTIPPAPILFLFTNDSVVVAFHVVSEDGLSYPSMARATNSSVDQGMEMSMEKPPPPVEATKPATSAFGSAVLAAPSFSQTGFGFGAAATPTFGSTGFGAAPAKSAFGGFGVSHITTGPTLGFGAFANAKPAFGQSSFGGPSGTTSTAASPPAQSTSGFGGGFAAFAGPKPTFGQSSFGAPATQSDAATSPFGVSAPATSPFGSSTQATSPFGATAPVAPPFGSFAQGTSAFGQPAVTPKSPVSPNADSTSGPSPAPQAAAQSGPTGQGASTAPAEQPAFKPASGFGAFSKLNTGGGTGFSFNNPKPIDPQAKPLAFSGFAGASTPSTNATSAPAFGAPTSLSQPKFGQSTPGKPAFGQSTFGQSTFGQSGFGQSTSAPARSPFATALATSSTTSPSGSGGFSAFASTATGFAALAKTANESRPAAHLGLPPGTPEAKSSTTTTSQSKPGSGSKSFFGTNANVSQPGFAIKGLRDSALKVDVDEDEEGASQTEEKFPEEAADELEPETTYEGPGLFGPPSGKGKATKGLGGLGLKDEGTSGGSSKAGGLRPVVAFGQRIDSSKVAVSAAAAFKPTTPVTKQTNNREDQSSSTAATTGAKANLSVPVSAFGSTATGASKPAQADAVEEGDKSGDEGSVDGSLEIDDDINEFLEGEDFDGEEVGDEEDQGSDDDENEEDDEGDDDEEEEDEEDGLSDLPDSDEEVDEEKEQTEVKPTKDTQPPPSAVKPAAPVPFNPFGRSAASSSTPTKETLPTTKTSSPSLLDSMGKAPVAREAPTSSSPATPSPRPQPIIQPVGTRIASVQSKAKPKPASPKAAFGSWTPVPTPKATDSSKPTRPQTPPGLFGKGSTAQPITSSNKVNPTVPSPLMSNDQGQLAKPVTGVKAIQPVHPELQAQLDRVLNEYSAILFHINERSKKVHALFDAFKGTGPPVGNEYQASFEWSGQSLPILRKTLDKMDETAVTISDRMSRGQRLLDELSSSTLRFEMKKEEASRYLRARQNPEFLEKIIKPRGLGPEHAESQIKLRKGLKAQTDRLVEVEEQVQRLKKKVDKFKAGKLSMQPPNLDDIRKTFQHLDWYISGLTDRLDNLDAKADALPSRKIPKEPRRLSATGAQNTIFRTSSFGPEIIATTAETFSAEVKMTKLSELMVEARTAAPVNRPKRNLANPQIGPTSSTRKTPFAARPIVLREVMTARAAQSHPTSATQIQHNRGPSAAHSPVNSTMGHPAPAPVSLSPNPGATPSAPPAVTPAKAPAPPVELARRAPPGANRQHTRAPQISRDGPVHTSSFSFGPPPAAASNAIKLPTNFVPITPQSRPQAPS